MSETTIDLERLLAPISEEAPTGQELSLGDMEGPLLKIKDAWDEARKLVREELEKERNGGIDSQGEPWRTIPHPDWSTVIDLSQETLQNQSKDFRIASWLTEALLREHQIRGLRDGLELCKGLCDNYWQTLHPVANDEDGHGVTVSAFAALVNEATYGALYDTIIVYGQKQNERSERRYSVLDYVRAKELPSLTAEEREQRLEQGQVEMGDFHAILELTPPEFLSESLDLIDQCISLLKYLNEFFRDNCRDDEYGEPTAPAISSFREELESIRRIITEFSTGESAATDDEQAGDDATGNASFSSPKSEMTRESAFQSIERIAQFFEKTEPHTPVHFALRQAVRWGRMPLEKLLAELIEDSSVMGSLRRQIGLPAEEQEY
ncbi:MAG: type VI secretion system protein TssA [Planctomycetales bacterium]|nr:type VI secretion system protein TssA [Planctomycetales bacterium]